MHPFQQIVESAICRTLEMVETRESRRALKRLFLEQTRGIGTLCSASDRCAYRFFLYLIAKEFAINTCVEIGTGGGWTARLIAEARPSAAIVTIDVLESPCKNVLDHCKNVTRIIGDSSEPQTVKYALEALNGKPIDLLFIDARHYPANVERELAVWLPHVRSPGIICFDDVCREARLKLKAWWESFSASKDSVFNAHALHKKDGFGIWLRD